jgi:hypothetical protein
VNAAKLESVTEPLPSWMTGHGYRIPLRLGPTPKDLISGQPINLRRK